MTRRLHPKILKAEAGGDYRRRCDVCGGLVCEQCSCCNGVHDLDSNYSNARGVYGKITTDQDGRTLHRECRYERDLLW